MSSTVTEIDAELVKLAEQWRRAELDHDDKQAEGTRRRIDLLLEDRIPAQRDAAWRTEYPSPDATR